MHRRYLAVLLLLAGAAAGCGARSTGLTTSGTIEATEVQVAAEVAGKVAAVLVQEGQKVKAGEAVARLDAAALELQLKQAEAVRAGARARLAEARAGARPEQVRQAEEAAAAAAEQARAAEQVARQAAANLEGARKNHATVKQLYDQGAATRQQMDAAQTALDAAAAQVSATRAQAQAAQRSAQAARAAADLVARGATLEQLDQLEAAVAQAGAAADLARLNLDRATLRAPVDGVVVRRLAEPGALLAPGAPVATLANLEELFLRVYVPATQVGQVQLGQAAVVAADAFPGRPFRADVVHISDRAEFTPKNVQTKEQRATTVYAVKLQVREGFGDLKPGMPADVTFPAAAPPGG